MKKISKLFLLTVVLFLVGWNTGKIEKILSKSSHIQNTGDRIAYISQQFLNTPYMDSTLKGSPDEKEELIINIYGMDCFTFLDYVEALRLSDTVENFPQKLKQVRYFDSKVAYINRKHFFTDWISGEHNTVRDITPEIAGAITVEKYINRRSDKKSWLNNLPQTMRMVTYIPSGIIDKEVIKTIHTGDYIGIYADKQGLDATHTGIFIRNDKGEFLRNASSLKGRVVDYPFKEYMTKVKGIIIFRPI